MKRTQFRFPVRKSNLGMHCLVLLVFLNFPYGYLFDALEVRSGLCIDPITLAYSLSCRTAASLLHRNWKQ